MTGCGRVARLSTEPSDRIRKGISTHAPDLKESRDTGWRLEGQTKLLVHLSHRSRNLISAPLPDQTLELPAVASRSENNAHRIADGDVTWYTGSILFR